MFSLDNLEVICLIELALTIQDFNLTSNNRESFFSPAGTFPLWQNITPPELYNNETLGLQLASGWRFLLGKYGGIPAISSLLSTGLNWDFPNSWPPHTCMLNFPSVNNTVADAQTRP
jgi:alpha,alpha-trehalase